MRRTAPLIVGGGPAGSSAAIALAQGGTRARLIERLAAPADVVCGGFVGWDALAALAALGIDAWALGAQPIARVRIVARGRVVERRLPHAAAGLSRRCLDAALLARAELMGVEVTRGVTVRRVTDGVAHLASGETIAPDALFLATGKHALRGAPRDGAIGLHVGLRTALPGAADLRGCIELHLLDRGYAGLLLQEDGCSNLCLSIAADRLAAAGSPAALIAMLRRESPALDRRLGDAIPMWTSIAGVPYGWRGAATSSGLYRLGDQAAVIASLAGDGIAVALASGRAAAAAWLRDGRAGAPAFQARFAARARRPIAIAEALRGVAERPAAAAAALAGPARLPGLLRLAASVTRIGA